jgi:AcrR family transcriptional regulator
MPRAGLTTLRVVQEAEDVADDCGLENLTLSAVAPRLGVRVPSLYKHVASMDALRRLLEIRAKAEIGDVLARATAGKAGIDALVGLSRAYRAWAKEHPGRYAAVLRAHDSDDIEQRDVTRAGLEIIFAALSSYGLKGDAEINAVRMLRANLHGFVALELAGGFGFPNDVDHSFDLLVGALDQTLSTWPPRAAAPQS